MDLYDPKNHGDGYVAKIRFLPNPNTNPQKGIFYKHVYYTEEGLYEKVKMETRRKKLERILKDDKNVIIDKILGI